MASMDEAILKRVLPHSLEAEQSVIGSMIMDREAIVVDRKSTRLNSSHLKLSRMPSSA